MQLVRILKTDWSGQSHCRLFTEHQLPRNIQYSQQIGRYLCFSRQKLSSSFVVLCNFRVKFSVQPTFWSGLLVHTRDSRSYSRKKYQLAAFHNRKEKNIDFWALFWRHVLKRLDGLIWEVNIKYFQRNSNCSHKVSYQDKFLLKSLISPLFCVKESFRTVWVPVKICTNYFEIILV